MLKLIEVTRQVESRDIPDGLNMVANGEGESRMKTKKIVKTLEPNKDQKLPEDKQEDKKESSSWGPYWDQDCPTGITDESSYSHSSGRGYR